MPIPQSAVRGCPVVDLRQGIPAVSMTALTTVPDFTRKVRPLIVTATVSGKSRLRARHALRQIRLRVDRRLSRKQMIRQ
jgi:hypothetical protein